MRSDDILRGNSPSSNGNTVTILNITEEFLVTVASLLVAFILYHVDLLKPYISNLVLKPLLMGVMLSAAIMMISTMLFCFTL